MDRRIKGVLLLAVVLLAAVVLPNLVPRTVGGAAEIGSIPVPPRVGQCLLQSPRAASGRGNGNSYQLGRCTTLHYGEVAEVVSDATAGARSTGDLASARSCGDESSYLGWSPSVPPTAQVRWRTIDLTVINMDPTPVQRAYGQRWSVCVVAPATVGSGYLGSVRNAMTTGRLPAAFAQCLTSRGLTAPTDAGSAVSCDRPHPAEVFGTAELASNYQGQRVLDANCLTIARSATRMSDPTAGGALRIQALPFHWDVSGDAKPGLSTGSTTLGAEALCTATVAGHRLLGGSLFGLGTRPLPWA
jgi:hypothetical protein